jgi:hypothetical protein
MNTQHERQEKIDNYLLDRLSEEERIAFEKEMQTDEVLREEVDLMQHIVLALQRKGEEEILQKHYLFGKYKKIILRSLSAAAVVILFISIGFRPKYTSEYLFTSYYNTEELQITPNRGEISAAEKQQETLYISTINQIATNDLATTIDNLAYLSSLSDFEYREESEWALALVYVKNNQRKDAQKILSQIIENHTYYAGNAQELAEQLKAKKWF